MYDFRTGVLGAAFSLIIMGGAVMPAFANTGGAAFEKAPMLEATAQEEILHEAALLLRTSERVTGEAKDELRKKWQRLEVKRKVMELQADARPYGQKLKSSVAGTVIPGADAVKWGERNMSIPALILFLVFGGVFAFMAFSTPSAHTGSHH